MRVVVVASSFAKGVTRVGFSLERGRAEVAVSVDLFAAERLHVQVRVLVKGERKKLDLAG